MKKPDRVAWLAGGDALCSNMPETPPGPPWRLVLMGAPGVGKGTQAEIISSRLGVCHLSTGDVLRSADCAGRASASPAIKSALFSMRSGALVEDDLMVELVAERRRCLRCCGGFVLDGFPRTVVQAEALEAMLAREGASLDAVFEYELPDEEIAERLGGRMVCPACKAVYHSAHRPPQRGGICDECGKRLVRREDDGPEAIATRRQAYEASNRPLLEWYARKGLLITVPAHGTPEEIYVRTWTCGRTSPENLVPPAG